MSLYTDLIVASRPIWWARYRDPITNGGVVRDSMRVLDLALPNPTTITAGVLDLPCYGITPPACFTFPNSQASSARPSSGLVNSALDLGSSDRSVTLACMANRVTDSVVSFPPLMTLGGSSSDNMTLYLLESLSRVDAVYRRDDVDTGTMSGNGFVWDPNTWAFPALRYNSGTGVQINVNGVDYGTRVNPTTKWTNGEIIARITPGNRAGGSNWEGRMADGLAWDREVPASELLAIWQASQEEPPTSGPGTSEAAHLVATPTGWR